MTWMQRISENALRKEIRFRGWSNEQQGMDALEVWKKGNEIFFTVGDWAKIDTKDIEGAIKRTYPDASIEWDYEAGPGDGNWEKIL